MIAAEPYLWTREQFDRMAEMDLLGPDARVELIGGEIVQMAPQDPEHTIVMMGVSRLLIAAFGPDFHIRNQVPFVIGSMSEPEPDIAIIEGDYRVYRKEHPTTATLVVEIARSSLSFDREVKTGLYASAGIQEFWIVDVLGRQLEVYREPIPIASTRFGYGYRVRLLFHPGDVIHPVAKPDASIAVAELFS